MLRLVRFVFLFIGEVSALCKNKEEKDGKRDSLYIIHRGQEVIW